MFCVYCKALDPEDFYIERQPDGSVIHHWVCSPFCLEGFLDEREIKARKVQSRRSPAEGNGGGELG